MTATITLTMIALAACGKATPSGSSNPSTSASASGASASGASASGVSVSPAALTATGALVRGACSHPVPHVVSAHIPGARPHFQQHGPLGVTCGWYNDHDLGHVTAVALESRGYDSWAQQYRAANGTSSATTIGHRYPAIQLPYQGGSGGCALVINDHNAALDIEYLDKPDPTCTTVTQIATQLLSTP